MATPYPTLVNSRTSLLPEERERLEKRRRSVLDYQPPKWRSNLLDDVSGDYIEQPMVDHANIVFIGPTGSGKSSLIGTLYRAVCEVLHFPDRVELVLNHPDADSHGTMHWLETLANRRGTVVYQDTRGDQEYDSQERTVHEFSLRGMYRDGARLQTASFLSKEWWTSRRFFWERGLQEIPHCVVFVFDGSSEPFLDAETLLFFQDVFQDCTKLGYEPVIVVTCLDLIHQETIRRGENYEVQVQHKRDKVLQAFEDLHLTRQSIYFVTNFHEGRRGGVKIWDTSDRGFEKVNKVMVDLTRDLLTVADRFIMRKYTAKNTGCLLL